MLQGFEDYSNGGKLMCATEQMGFFKIAFVYCFQFLKNISEKCKSASDLNPSLYQNIMTEVITQGGDTDTNACIVGGLVGSIVGFRNLPHDYLVKQLKLRLG